MEPIIIAVLCGMATYAVTIALIPKRYLAEQTHYTRGMLKKMAGEYGGQTLGNDDLASVLRDEMQANNLLTRIFFTLPGSNAAYPRLLKAGLQKGIDKFFLFCLAVFVISLFIFKSTGGWDIVFSTVITWFVGRWLINRNIRKRSNAFLNLFPDALDMIVRSVRSGYPFNAAVRMVAENMEPPVSTEFKQVADETAYGSSLMDALKRLAQRIDEPDIHFFVVVLSVQQEVGGNLAEVLSNLSGIIRKRKHLRLKIKALSSEGKATGWVLGALPFVVALLIHLTSPHHLTPLFETHLGHMMLIAIFAIIGLGIFIMKQMINIEI